MTGIARRRSAFGLSIGSIFASFILIGAIQVLIAALRVPLSQVALNLINFIIRNTSRGTNLRTADIQWFPVFENLAVSVLFIAAGLLIGAWLRRDPR